MATKTLTTRIALKTDTTANWSASTLVLLKGEQAIEIPESGEYKLKIGDGVNTFKDLPYVAMTPTEIKNLINSGAVQTVSLASGTNNGTVKLTVDGTVTDNIAVKGLGSAAYTNSGAYATAGHGHSISGVSGLQAALDSKSAVGHTHDDRYYTESEMNTKLAGKANSSHTHGSGDITSLDASKLTGTINIERLPAGALERCVIVADDAARLKLTTKDVQKGDTVKVTATGKMYFVIDDSKLSTEDGYTVYTAGTATSVPWSGVTGKPSTFTPSAHTHTIANITGLQNALNGKANSSHTHSIDNVTGLQSALDGKSNTNHGHTSITTYGEETIGKVADDTTANWASKNNSIHFYKTDKLLNGQPSQYGFLFNMAQGESELHQIWAAHGGSLYHRYGNANGIETTWREVLDSSNYTNYTVTKGGSGATGTWGISITGNAATASKCTGNAATATVADSAKACTGNSATATKLATARKIGNASFDGSADITLSAIGAASSGHTHNYAGSSSVGGAANSAVKLSTARAFSITGGATAAAVSFDGSAAVALNVTSVSTDVLNNGSNTLILSCGGAA
ncbi:hypothetical protein DW846_02515 [Ruminococcus sp. AM36-2AA]|nr:hypothetical protein DW851_02510 [Ruminococcus sp. AM36-5]RGH62489.1 hypothetical protein DW846_02515 [Ruminococcus sp. AM36-2AA]